MPRYFFHVRDGLDVTDEQGTELPDLRAAKREALRVMSAFFHAADYDPDRGGWALAVTDAEQRELFTLRPDFVGA